MNFGNRSTAPEDRRGIIVVSALTVIAARKVDFVSGLLAEIRESSTFVDHHTPGLSELSRTENKIVDIVSQLDWGLFVTEKERELRTLDPRVRIEDLDRRRLWNRIEVKLRESVALPKAVDHIEPP